jgi:hypothetical protein
MAIDFHKYIDSWSALKKYNLRQHFESQKHWWEFQKAVSEETGSPFTYRRTVLEEAWIKQERPYYTCYPAVLPMLMKLRLDIPCASVDFKALPALEVRLPKDQGVESPFRWGEHQVRTVLFGLQEMPREIGSEELTTGLCACYDVGETDELGDPVYSFRLFPLRDDKSIEEAMALFSKHESATTGLLVPEEIALNVIKLCVCLALLDNDPSMITPDVLAKDTARWDAATEEERQQMVAMAHRRGKVGWNVGASIEHIPHFRRPHPALVRIGKGRTLSRIVIRKGSVVHRSKITSIPTGHERDYE